MPDLDAVEARSGPSSSPYKDELEEATIYGMPSLRWPGTGSHDYFAAVKRVRARSASTRSPWTPGRRHSRVPPRSSSPDAPVGRPSPSHRWTRDSRRSSRRSSRGSISRTGSTTRAARQPRTVSSSPGAWRITQNGSHERRLGSTAPGQPEVEPTVDPDGARGRIRFRRRSGNSVTTRQTSSSSGRCGRRSAPRRRRTTQPSPLPRT